MFNGFGDLLAEDHYRLPQGMGRQICEWGGGGSPDMSGSQSAMMYGQANALAALQNMYGQARADVAPWRQAGTAGVNQLSGLLGLPGYTAIDPTAMLTSTPGYKFLQDQGMQSLARYGAASGLGASGAAMKGAQNYGQGLAQTYAWQPYMNSLQNLSGQGLQAGGMSGNWAMQTGMAEANLFNNTANQLAQMNMQQQMAQQNQSPWNDIMGGVGFLGSMALAPFTGGTSMLGGFGSLGSLFGGGSNPQVGGYGSATSFGNTMPTASSMSYGFMADGGPTEANKPYIIGERGPELFVPDRPGYIIPNHLMEYSSLAAA